MLAALDVETIVKPQVQSARGSSRALIFLIDRGYLNLLQVFCHSLAKLGTFNQLPIIIVSEDADVLQDSFVTLIADQRFHLDSALVKRLEDTAARAYKRPGKEAWNRATFFKWSVFRDWGVDEALFLDCDMLPINDPSDIFSLSRADLVGAPQFQSELYKNKDDKRLPLREITRRTMNFVRLEPGSKISLNSGVMLMRRPVLSERFRDELIRYTQSTKAVNEQQFIAKFMAEERPGRLQYVSPIYNFQASFLVRLSLHTQLHLLSDIRIIHYAGRDKPWSRPPSRANFGSVMWRLAVEEADRFYTARRIQFTRPGK